MNKPYGWVDEINTFVLEKDYRQLPKSLQNGMTPLYANKTASFSRAETGRHSIASFGLGR